MAKTEEVIAAAPIDEFAADTFLTLGFKKPFPPLLVYSYHAFKAVRDKLQPGRLSPEGFATVVSIYNWAKEREKERETVAK